MTVEAHALTDPCGADGAPVAPPDWIQRVVDGLAEFDIGGEPTQIRRLLRRRARENALAFASRERRYLLLLFGSLARAEAASDIDLIVVTAGAPHEHRYWRIPRKTRHVDLNVVNENWLRDAWLDVEYGYWLNESYVLDATDDDLVTVWKRSCNLYWSPASVRGRAGTHRAMTLQLLAAHARAHEAGLPLVSRLIGHEAAHACGCLLIDRRGGRAYSRRTFLAELHVAAREANRESVAVAELRSCLAGGGERCDDAFARLRGAISSLFRNGAVASLIGFDRASPRAVRVAALCTMAQRTVGPQLEQVLERAGFDRMLPPSASLASVMTAIETLARDDAQGRPRPFVLQHALSTARVPRRGDIAGARWVACENGRLKIVLNTGGCKTPSCSFCALPAYGRSAPRANVAATLESALAEYRPREVALYNDGNWLNPREVAAGERLTACDALRRHGVSRLTIESIPRYVAREVVAEVLARSGVDRLTVAMGLQCVGNAFAVVQLGRPDVDALFDFAIDEVHEARGKVRLYLLWGYGETLLEQWSDRVERSIEWARARDVDKISVCPYISPIGGGSPDDWAMALNALRQRLNRLRLSPSGTLEILDQSLHSCARKEPT